MWYSGIQKEEQAKSIVGEVYLNEPSHPLVQKKSYDPIHHFYFVSTENEIDQYHYFSDHLGILKKGYCRECGKVIGKHSAKYYAKKHIDGTLYSILYSADNGYCKECSYKLGHIYSLNSNPLTLVSHTEHSFGSFEGYYEKNIFSDGSITERDSDHIVKSKDL